MPSTKVKIIIKVAADLLLVLAVALPILIFWFIGEPFQRGFFCDDATIRYPYKDSTVTSGALYVIGTVLPISFICIIEYFHVRNGGNGSQDRNNLRLWFWSVYRYVGIFLFGCALSHLTVDICKYSIGRLRPHFIDVCKPNFDNVDCSSVSYITDANICTNKMDTHEEYLKMREARLSFMSGHASFSAYTMFFLIIYLQARLLLRNFQLVRPFFQYIFFGITVFTCMSRISDNKHHWSDVLVGFINGIVFAFFTTLAIAGLDPRKHSHNRLAIGLSEIKVVSPSHRRSDVQSVIDTTVNGRELNSRLNES